MIKKTIKIVLASLLFTFNLNNIALANNSKYKATVKKVKNRVEYKYEESSIWKNVDINQEIYPITSIRTGASSKAELMFSDGSVTRIGSRTSFTLLNKQNRAVRVQLGRVWFDIKKKSHGLKIYAPDAVASITGTEGYIEFNGNAEQEEDTYTVKQNDTVEKIANKILGNKATKVEKENFIQKILSLNSEKIKKQNFLYEGDEIVINKTIKLNVDKSKNYFALGLIEGSSDVFKADEKGNIKSEAQKVKEGELLVLKNGNFSIGSIYDNLKPPKGMIAIQGSSFNMGGDGESDEKPIHKVTIRSFYIGKNEVTQSEYVSLMGKNPSTFKGENLPVENISWWDAIKYCNKKSLIEKLPIAYNEKTGELLDENGNITNDITKVVGYRLPTEAEWEYTAKGGNKSNNHKYSGSDDLDEVAWYGYEKSGKTTHSVGSKKHNEVGAYDMSGNVSEWVYDAYISDSYKKEKESMNPIFNIDKKNTYRVYRGGSWNYIEMYQRVFTRSGYIPEYKGDNIGFRIAKNIDF